MSERTEALTRDLNETRAYLNAVLDKVGNDPERQVYSDGLAWSVRQIVAHLVSADTGHNAQAMNAAQGVNIIPEDFDIQRYNKRITEKSAEKTIAESRAALAESRQALLEWLATVDDELLDKQGRHSTLQMMTVEEIIRFGMKHERGHADDIAQAFNITV